MAALTRCYSDAPVLILGAGGFIGGWVVRALDEVGARPVAVVRPGSGNRVLPSWVPDSRRVECDLENLRAVADLIAAERPAAVFNLAGYGVSPDERSGERAFRINRDLVAALVEPILVHGAPGWKGARLIHAGSALEYGEASGDLSEDTEPKPTTVYGRSKLAGTLALTAGCRRSGLKGVVARLFTVYGPGESGGRLLPTLVAASHDAREIPLTAGTHRRDFTFVEDVAEGLVRLAVEPPVQGSVVNLATGRLMAVRSFVETAARVLGIAADRLRFGALTTRGWEMRHEDVNVSRLSQLTRWKPSTLPEEGILRTARAPSGG
jgi:nucleoside-diphosphate-sugar epimerase